MQNSFVESNSSVQISGDEAMGGAIVFFFEVNASKYSAHPFTNALLQKYHTLRYRLLWRRIMAGVIRAYNAEAPKEIGNYSYTLQHGVYYDKADKRHNESSVKLELFGVSREQLTAIAMRLREVFNQCSVMVLVYHEGVKFHIKMKE